MKAFIINDTEKEYHWGCYGTSSAIKKQLMDRGVTEIASVSCKEGSKPENTSKKCLLVYSKNPLIRYIAQKYYVSVMRRKLPAVWQAMLDSDYIVINGEGTINSIHVATRFIFFMVFIAKEVMKKRVCIINHSCYPKRDKPKQMQYYQRVYAKCDFIAAREPASQLIITERLGVKATLAFDSLPLSVKETENIPASLYSGKYICVSGAVNYDTRNSALIASGLRDNYPDHHIVYLTGSASGMNNEDPDVIASLQKYIPEMIVHDAHSFTEWLSVIKHSVLLISGRYHYSVAAMCFGTPMICFSSNTPKIDEVNKLFRLPKCVKTRDEFMHALNSVGAFSWTPLLDEMCHLAEQNYIFLPLRT
ncbi:polysaccharide pyruvyl transferase family protein [Citrobacter amalonaticus]|uniref:polysaccharide pyruvyl transferase family protein n=1 Tax=Citrobacter amalonaticus TaxID=35703 RepID=UPI00300C883E